MTDRRTEIEEQDGELAAVYTYHGNDGTAYQRLASYGDQGYEEAWRAVVLDTARPLAHREQALNALLEAAHESHYYDCSEG